MHYTLPSGEDRTIEFPQERVHEVVRYLRRDNWDRLQQYAERQGGWGSDFDFSEEEESEREDSEDDDNENEGSGRFSQPGSEHVGD